MSFLLDTNVISELRRPRCDENVRAWFEAVEGEELFLSVLVLGEIRQGIERLRPHDPKRAQLFERWLVGLIRDYRDRLLPISDVVAELWGRLNTPRALPVVDTLLAATALAHGLTLVTRNVIDVERTGVALLNPFADAAHRSGRR